MSAADETTTGYGAGGAAPPSEEELRAAYEAELARISATDMIAQSLVSLLNVGARRMGPPPDSGQDPQDGRDLEQARDAIDAAKALLAILERRIPNELAPLRDALSRLQMAYAAEVGAAGASPVEQAAKEPSGQQQAPAQQQPEQSGERRPGPAESSGRLWVPGR